jgi:histidinol-phosphate/aromatic aminotransferase/cobyric acid decarboxylase-like protein
VAGPNFDYDSDYLLAQCRAARPTALVLVNPDNPSGHLLSPRDLVALLNGLAELGTRLVLDESFVDFVDGSPDHGLLRNELLLDHSNLVVIRSLGKSYGVAGLRLGVVATSDADLLRRVEARLPIWNINAVAEAFLQRAPLYDSEYRSACRQVALERARLQTELSHVGWLRPVPSAANFLLCELTGGVSAQAITRDLLRSASILVKDCSGKPGLGSGQFLRFAVRDATDNARLLTALSTIHLEKCSLSSSESIGLANA